MLVAEMGRSMLRLYQANLEPSYHLKRAYAFVSGECAVNDAPSKDREADAPGVARPARSA